MLAKETVPILMTGGSDAGATAPQLNAGLVRVVNASLDLQGAISKRRGQDDIATTFGASQIHRIGDSALLTSSGGRVDIMSLGSAPSSVPTGLIADIPPIGVEYSHLYSVSEAPHVADRDVVRLGDYLVSVRTGSSATDDIITTVTHSGNGSSVSYSEDTKTSAARVVLLPAIDRVAIYYYATDEDRIEVAFVDDDGSHTAGIEVTTAANPSPSTSLCLDACCMSDGSTVALTWYDATAGKIRLAILPLGVDAGSATADLIATATPVAAAVAPTGAAALCAYTVDDAGTDKTYAQVRKIDASSCLTESLITSTTEDHHMTTCVGCLAFNAAAPVSGAYCGSVVVSRSDTSMSPVGGQPRASVICTLSENAGAVFESDTRALPWHAAYSKPARTSLGGLDQAIAIFTCHHSRWTSSGASLISYYALYLIDVDRGIRLIGTLAPGVACAASRPCLHAESQDDLGVIGLARVIRQFSGRGGGYLSGLTSVDAATLSSDTFQATESDGSCLIGGLLPAQVDASGAIEHGWLDYPEELRIDRAATAGSLTIGGSYRYVALYEHTDAAGRRHLSSPTPLPVAPANAPDAGHRSCTIVVASPITRRPSTAVYAVAYRTVDGGGIYYRAARKLVTSTVTTITDSVSDADLTGNERLYTTGGVLESVAPDPYRSSCIYQGRHVVDSIERRSTVVRYSRQKYSLEPYHHNAVYEVSVPEDGGKITALSVASDRLVIWKESSIYATEGEGYSDDGGGANMVRPYCVSRSIGCTDRLAMCDTPDGTAFVSSDGIYLLNSKFQTVPVGAKVSYYTDRHQYTAAVSVDAESISVFTSPTGPALVYWWQTGEWSIWTGHESSSAAAIGGAMIRLGLDGHLYRQSSDYDDDGSRYSMICETGWIPLSGIGGFGRLYELLIVGNWVEKSKLAVQVGYDYDLQWETAQTISSPAKTYSADDYVEASADASYADQAMAVRCVFSRQKCSAIRIRIYDDDNALTDSAGISISAMSLLVGKKTGVARSGRTRTIGA